MGIQGALYSGVSGMSVNSTSMEVIGNNIANSNTYGYKTSRTVFSDALSNVVSSSSGTSQVGSGAMLSSVDNVFGQGTFETTTSDTDLAIQGEGLFIVKDGTTGPTYYTRSGAFSVQNGSLLNSEGYVVQGYSAANSYVTTTTVTEYDDYGNVISVEASTEVGSEDKESTSVDSGNTNTSTVTEEEAVVGSVVISLSNNLEIGVSKNDDDSLLESVSIDSEGIVYGTYADGTSEPLYCIAIAKFSNPSGLEKEGNSMYSASEASGDAAVGTIEDLGGTIYSSTLEMSNVDLAQEFVKMITTQRGFQANSKIITTTDELLNEVINLKR